MNNAGDGVLLSDKTVAQRMSELSRDIEELALEKIRSSLFALQADEASDYSGKCHLLTFIRFVDEYNIIHQFLFTKEIKTSMTGEDIFQVVDISFTRHGMLWDHCVGICTGRAPSMTGRLKGFVTSVKATNQLIISTYCFIHREAPTLNDAAHVVSYIKGRPLKS